MIRDIADYVLKRLERVNVTEAEVYVVKTVRSSLKLSEIIESLRTSENIGVGVRVVIGKKVGIYGTNDVTKEGLDKVIDDVVSIAKSNPEDPYWVSLAKGLGKSSVNEIFDKKLVDADPSLLTDKASLMIDSVKSVSPNARPARGSLRIDVSEVVVGNSYGELVSRKETAVSTWIQVKAEEEGKSVTYTELDMSRVIDDIDFEGLGKVAASKAIEFLKATKVETMKTDVIFDAKEFAHLLSVMLSGPISAEWVQKGRSPLAGKVGMEIFSKEVTILDDGTYPRMVGSREFDDEGIPTRKTVIVDGGVLRGFIYDTYTANKEGKKSTGNAHRTISTAPTPQPNNLVMKPGTTSLDEVIKDTKRGIYVLATIGMWLSNPVSGNINATVTHGYLIENGELSKPIKGFIISGDFYELMKSKLVAITKETSRFFNVIAPYVKFSDVQISA